MEKRLAYLALGSNLGDRESNLGTAVARLHQPPDLEVKRVSSVWETEPMYRTDQPTFLNCVIEVETTLLAPDVLRRAANIERELGRRRTTPNAPRPIDIDIVLFGPLVMDLPELQVPHPRMAERRFVLEPLAELAPDLRHPVTNQTIREILAAAPGQFLRPHVFHIPVPGLPGVL